MRDIKFRAWDKENNCWRYGWYTKLQEGARKYHAIICDENGTLTRYYIHDEKTVGQFTGSQDKNSKDIYEKDIAKIDGHNEYTYVVQYRNTAFVIESTGTTSSICGFTVDEAWPSRIEIIGNIHENPEWAS